MANSAHVDEPARASRDTGLPSNAKALGLLLWLKWTLMWRSYRRDRMAVIGIIFALVFVIPISLATGIGAAVLLAKLDPARAGTLLATGLLSTYAVWIIGPMVGFAFNESYDITKLFGYPLSMRQIFAGALIGAVIDVPILFFAPGLFGVVFGFARNALAVAFTPLVLLCFIVHVVSLSQTALLLTSGFLSSRRFRDSMTVVMPLIAMSIYFVTQIASRRMISEGAWQWLLEGRLPAIAHYLPPGMAAQAIAEGAQGHWLAALSWLGVLAAITVATLYAASWAVGLAYAGEVGAVGYRLRRPPLPPTASTDSSARALPSAAPWPPAPAGAKSGPIVLGDAPSAVPVLLGDAPSAVPVVAMPHAGPALSARRSSRVLPPVMSAIIAKELAYVRRDPFYKLLMVNALYFMGVMAFAFWRAGRAMLEAGPVLLWLTPVLLVFSMQVLNNLYGVEGSAAGVLFGSPSPRRALIVAKNLVFGALFGAFAITLTVVGGIVLHAGVSTLLYVLWVFLVLVVMTAAGNLISIYLPYRVVMRGWRMRASMANRGCGYVFLYLAILLGTVVIMLPVFLGLWLPAQLEVPGLWVAGIPFSTLYALGLYAGSVWLAGRLLQEHEPEILEKLALDPGLG